MRFINGTCAALSLALLAACGGGNALQTSFTPEEDPANQDPGSIVPRPDDIGDINGAPTVAAAWRRLNNFTPSTASLDKDGAVRYFPDNSECTRCVPEADFKNLYSFKGGLGTVKGTSPGGAALFYRNMSYATFGSYYDQGQRYRHFYVGQPTPTGAVPTSGSATYSGKVIYRDTEDGDINLTADFGGKTVSGNVNNLSATKNNTLEIDGKIDGNSIRGGLHYQNRNLQTSLPGSDGAMIANFTGPQAEQIVGRFTLPDGRIKREHPDSTAAFGAERQQ